MDIILPYHHSPYHELRYALRSICKYQPHDRVILVGDTEEWYKGDVILKEDTDNRPEFSVASKILRGIQEASEDFILWQDDIFKLNDNPVKPVYCDTLKHIMDVRHEGRFKNVLSNTYALFPDGYYYGGHTPMVMNGKLFEQAVDECWKKDLIPKTMYGNYAKIGGEHVADCKIKGSNVYGVIKNFIAGKDYLSTGHYSMNKDMVKVLEELFPEKCRYEN